jgi:hypothetical protein
VRRRLAAVVAAVALVAGACGDTLGRDELVASFRRDFPRATEEQAGCVVDRLLERFEVEEIEQELSAEGGSSEFGNATVVAMAACGYDLTDSDQWRVGLVGALVGLGYDTDDAGCIADRLIPQLDADDVAGLVSGELPDGFRARLAEAADGCGVG